MVFSRLESSLIARPRRVLLSYLASQSAALSRFGRLSGRRLQLRHADSALLLRNGFVFKNRQTGFLGFYDAEEYCVIFLSHERSYVVLTRKPNPNQESNVKFTPPYRFRLSPNALNSESNAILCLILVRLEFLLFSRHRRTQVDQQGIRRVFRSLAFH